MAILAEIGGQAAGWMHAVTGEYGEIGVQIVKIIWINILLSGDNAVVIALACRSLPERQRRWGIILGAGAAVVLRIIFTVGIQYVLTVPYLKLIGGLLLFWIAVKLVVGEEADEGSVKDSDNLWGAIRTVAIADMVMSLDNVLAIAAAAHGHTGLIILGLVISIPLIVVGATLIMGLLTRFPVLVWAGAALLGWIAGELLVEEVFLRPYFDQLAQMIGFTHHGVVRLLQALGAVFVVIAGWLLARGRASEETVTH